MQINNFQDILDIPEDEIERALDKVRNTMLIWYEIVKPITRKSEPEAKDIYKITFPGVVWERNDVDQLENEFFKNKIICKICNLK